VRFIDQTGTKVGLIEPNFLNDKLFDHQIKETPGITELWKSSVHSEIFVCHLNVDSLNPGVEVDSKGLTVRQLK